MSLVDGKYIFDLRYLLRLGRLDDETLHLADFLTFTPKSETAGTSPAD